LFHYQAQKICENIVKEINQTEVKTDTTAEYSTGIVSLQTQTYIMWNTFNKALTIENIR